MTKHLPVVAALLALGTWSVGAESTLPDGATPSNQSDNHPAKVDQAFVDHAATGGMYEVETSKLALDKGVPDRVRDVANMMIKDHSKANDQLAQLARSRGYDVPNELNKVQRHDMNRLRDRAGDDFVREYDKDQLSAHDNTIKLFEEEAKHGKDAELQKWASDTLPALRHHRDMIVGLPGIDEKSSYRGNEAERGSQAGVIPAGRATDNNNAAVRGASTDADWPHRKGGSDTNLNGNEPSQPQGNRPTNDKGTVDRADAGIQGTNPNGSIDRTNPDGAVNRVNSDGTVNRVNADGSVDRVNPDGSVNRVDNGSK